MSVRVFLVALLLACTLPACEADNPDGVCFWQYNKGDTWGFGCQKGLENTAACQDLVRASYAESEIVNLEWSAECADIGCTGTCGPSWWSLY